MCLFRAQSLPGGCGFGLGNGRDVVDLVTNAGVTEWSQPQNQNGMAKTIFALPSEETKNKKGVEGEDSRRIRRMEVDEAEEEEVDEPEEEEEEEEDKRNDGWQEKKG